VALRSGWKDIGDAFRIKTKKTMIKLYKKYKLPIIFVGRTPTITDAEIQNWRDAVRSIMDQQKNAGGPRARE
jgi:hypothetical protein